MDNPGIKNGVFMGLGLIILNLVLYFISTNVFISYSSIIAFIFYIFFMYRAAVEERSHNDGWLSFADALKASFLAFVIGALIYTLFNYVLYNFIDPDLIDTVKDITRDAFEQASGLLSEEMFEDMEEAMEISINEMNFSLPTLLMGYLINLIFPGFIIALIIAAITKKKLNTFA